MKRYSIALIMLLSSNLIVFAQEELSDLQVLAASNNPQLKSLYKQYEAAMAQVPQKSGLPDPTLGIGYFVSPVETRVGPQRASFSLSQSFPWFGELGANEQASEERAKIILERFYDAKGQLFLDLSTSYYDLYVLYRAIEVLSSNIELLETYKEIAEVKVESSSGSLVDVLSAEIELEELRNQLYLYEDSKEPLLLDISKLINTEFIEPVFADQLWSDSLMFDRLVIIDSLRTNNADLKAADHKIAALNYDLTSSKKQGGPDITIGLNYTIIGERANYSGEDNGRDAFLPSIGVKLPIYRSKYNGLTQQKTFEIESAQLEKVDIDNRLVSEVSTVYKDYNDAVRRIAMNKRLIGFGTQALDIMVSEYSSAKTEFSELLQMDRQLLTYKLKIYQAQADRNLAVSHLRYLIGHK
jgi:cobalt-zinc-cadmium efflux system outer membrane protein